jgi:hypothetical protein
MTTRIDEQLNTRYLVPGVDLGTAASAEMNGFEEDSGDLPYSQLPALMDIPSPTGWQDMLGLNQIAPSPDLIGPPPRMFSYMKKRDASNATASLHLPASAPGSVVDPSAALKIGRMKAMLAKYDQTVRGIHLRASQGGRP